MQLPSDLRLFDILYFQKENFPKETCFSSKDSSGWKSFSTETIIEKSEKFALGLIRMGMQPGDRVAVVSNNRPEWNISDFGMLMAGVINVPVYPTISEQEYKFIFNDAGVKLCFVSDKELFNKVNSIRNEVPSLTEVFSFNDIPGALSWTEVIQRANETDRPKLEQVKKRIHTTDLATIIYTSGTTGVPKGVMLSHRNIASNVRSTLECLPINETHRTLSFLPICHIFERMVIYTYMATGCSIYYAESMDTIADNLKEIKPHYFTTVPRLLEKVYDKILAKGNTLKGIPRKLFFWSLSLGLKYDDEGKNNPFYRLQLFFARAIIFKKWQAALGGEVEGIVTGAAALQPRLARVFNAAGISVREGYGLTESSPVIAFNRFEKGGFKIGTVGPPIPGVQVKIAEDGEILAQGPNIMMGYYKRDDLTKEVIDENKWLHTGDIGIMVDNKFLKITDRKKELFKTSGGKYVAPQPIENKMKESPFIEQILVIGENQKFTAALIVPALAALKSWASEEKGLNFANHSEMIANHDVKEKVGSEIDRLNTNFSHIEQIKKFELIDQEWTVDSGELTPTMKTKRKVILEKYAGLVAKIYRQ